MNDWKNAPILTRADGSFVIQINGNPYHVPNLEEWAALWMEVHKHAAMNPGQVSPEPESVEEGDT